MSSKYMTTDYHHIENIFSFTTLWKVVSTLFSTRGTAINWYKLSSPLNSVFPRLHSLSLVCQYHRLDLKGEKMQAHFSESIRLSTRGSEYAL